MAKDDTKTNATDAGVTAFIEAVSDDQQRADAQTIAAMMQRLTGHLPKMWGSSIIGFGRYHYRYESGREGDMARISFSPRKGKTVLYIADGFVGHADLLAKLGKHKTGQSCLYIKQLYDIDGDVLEELCAASLRYMAENYPQ